MPVVVGLFEALLGNDVGVSQSRVRAYHDVVVFAFERARTRADECGYELRLARADYNGSAPLAPLDSIQTLKEKDAWIALGPSQSKHAGLAASGAGPMPFVAPLTPFSYVETMGENVFVSGSEPSNGMSALVETTRAWGFGSRYVTMVPIDCERCRAFVAAFESAARRAGLVKAAGIVLEPPTGSVDIAARLKGKTYDFLVVPAPERIVLPVLEALARAPSTSTVRIVGDGNWGAPSQFRLSKRPRPRSLEGLFKRDAFDDSGIARLTGGKELLQSRLRGPDAFTSYDVAILVFFDELVTRLCLARPANKDAFWGLTKTWNRVAFEPAFSTMLLTLTGNTLVTVRGPAGIVSEALPWPRG